MRKLPITLVGYVTSDDEAFYRRTDRVLRYCQNLFEFERTILFSHIDPGNNVAKADHIQIPMMEMDQMNVWINCGIPPFIESDYVMYVHEDGMILDPKLWRDEFLTYDFLGAPWADGIVGNHGFSVESQKLLRIKRDLPFSPKLTTREDGWLYHASDVYLCRVHRRLLEDYGIKFAPKDVAVSFSTEQTGQVWPSFGYHGRRCSPEKYAASWALLEAWESGK